MPPGAVAAWPRAVSLLRFAAAPLRRLLRSQRHAVAPCRRAFCGCRISMVSCRACLEVGASQVDVGRDAAVEAVLLVFPQGVPATLTRVWAVRSSGLSGFRSAIADSLPDAAVPRRWARAYRHALPTSTSTTSPSTPTSPATPARSTSPPQPPRPKCEGHCGYRHLRSPLGFIAPLDIWDLFVARSSYFCFVSPKMPTACARANLRTLVPLHSGLDPCSRPTPSTHTWRAPTWHFTYDTHCFVCLHQHHTSSRLFRHFGRAAAHAHTSPETRLGRRKTQNKQHMRRHRRPRCCTPTNHPRNPTQALSAAMRLVVPAISQSPLRPK